MTPHNPMSIQFPNTQGTINTLTLKTQADFENYKYLGIELNLNLNFNHIFKQTVENFKKHLNAICTKCYLGPKLIIKLINTIAIPKISYPMFFILFPTQSLQSLDQITYQKICHTFKIPSTTKKEYWYTVYYRTSKQSKIHKQPHWQRTKQHIHLKIHNFKRKSYR